MVILNTARNVPPELTNRVEPTWRNKRIKVRKFVDDNLQVQKLHMKKQTTYLHNGIVFKNPRVTRSEKMFKHIATRAIRKGLKVNAAKTNLLAVSASTSYQAKAHIYDENDQRIDCQNDLKALGFIFNSRGDVSSQIDMLCRKFRRKVWTLRHLRKNNFSEDELLKVYKSNIRPTIEYSAPIYHPMLTAEQSNRIERLQYFALKNIYGFAYSHRELIELSSLPSLQQRRVDMTKKFAQKTLSNGRFKEWFPMRRTGTKRKKAETFLELPARTDRRRNSPIFHYRRLLNEDRINYDIRTL